MNVCLVGSPILSNQTTPGGSDFAVERGAGGGNSLPSFQFSAHSGKHQKLLI